MALHIFGHHDQEREIAEANRRHAFIERMERKLIFKQSLRHHPYRRPFVR